MGRDERNADPDRVHVAIADGGNRRRGARASHETVDGKNFGSYFKFLVNISSPSAENGAKYGFIGKHVDHGPEAQ